MSSMTSLAAKSKSSDIVSLTDKARPNQIDTFLEILVKLKGSDLHLSPGVPPMLRINGKLRRLEYPMLTPQHTEQLLQEIMSPHEASVFMERKDVDFAYEIPDSGRFRVNAMQSRKGFQAVFRTIPSEIPTADELGLPPAVRQLVQLHKGLVLVTGATGSGKSTTLASLIHTINHTRHSHILTIEDPIEFVHESKKSLVTQREVGQNAESFERALRAGLREDPDVILVGEMRDVETISLAVTAAETGHLVFGTLHTSSAAKSIDRIVDSFPAGQQAQIRVQLAESLRCIVAQQLLPRRTGQGRVAAFEVLMANPAISNQIREGKSHQIPSTMQTSRKGGMMMMDDALMLLVKRREIDPGEALSRAHNRKGFREELREMGMRF